MKEQCYAVYCDGHFIRLVRASTEKDACDRVQIETFAGSLTGVGLVKVNLGEFLLGAIDAGHNTTQKLRDRTQLSLTDIHSCLQQAKRDKRIHNADGCWHR